MIRLNSVTTRAINLGTYISREEALLRLGIAERTLAKWVQRGLLHRFWYSGRAHYRNAEVLRLVEEGAPDGRYTVGHRVIR